MILFLRVVGWLAVPFIMIFVDWKKMNGSLRVVGGIYSFVIIIALFSNNGDDKNLDASASEVENQSITTTAPTTAPTPTPTIDPVVQKANEEKAKLEAEVKAKADKAAKDKADADAKKAVEDKKKKLAEATINLKTKVDEVEDITWYRDKTSPEYTNHNGFYLYFAKDKDDSVNNLRLRIQYAGDDWVFIDKYIFKVDDQSFTLSPDYGVIKRDNGSGGVWEYYDYPLTGDTLEIVKAIAASTKTIIRSQGDQDRNDRTITISEKKSITHILDAYEAMGGSQVLLKFME